MASDETTVPAGMEVIWAMRETLPMISPAEGIEMRLLVGGAMMMSLVTLAPGAIVPLHQHPNEQMGYMLEGVMALRIGDETREIGPGACYLVPGGVSHEGSSVEGCLVLDVFSPPRADYAERARMAADSAS